jgi:D-amino peptidase
MKIYIHTDLEGVTGITDSGQIQREDRTGYQRACGKLMRDLNAAVAGAFDGGADHVTVLDSHGGGGNFILEKLDPRAQNDIKPNKRWWGIMDDSYDGTFFIGAHAMAGTQNAFLDHTQSSARWYNYYLNGRKYGELGQWATVAGNFDIPLLLVTGDEAACTEAREFFNPIETVAVKHNRAQGYPEEEVRQRIREAAARAIPLAGQAPPLKPVKPLEIKLEVYRSDYLDEMMDKPGLERLDARTVRKVVSSPLEILF